SDTIAIAAVPATLAWRFERLRAQWRAQDAAADAAPIIDPDLVGVTDIKNPNLADPAFQLLKTRRDFLDRKLAELKTLRQSQQPAPAALDAILGKANVLPAQLQALAARLAQGENIGPEIAALRLSVPAFSFLTRIRKLAQSNAVVLDAEWAEVESILAQALKRDAFPSWRSEEQQRQICLSPEFFLADQEAPSLSPWRASASARREWLAMLQARSDQEQAAVTAWQAAVRAAEEAALRARRDALILASD